MPILNKEGKVYTLRGPNPILVDQDRWDTQYTVLLNFEDVDTVVIQDKKYRPRPVEEEIAEVVPEEEEPELLHVIEVEEPPATPQPASEIDQILGQKSIPILCMPVISQTKHTNDMGDTYISNQYGDQITIRGIIVDNNDIQFLFWTDQKLNQNSVIFPQNMDKRCWRINRVEEKTGGYLHECFPSQVHPVFKSLPQH